MVLTSCSADRVPAPAPPSVTPSPVVSAVPTPSQAELRAERARRAKAINASATTTATPASENIRVFLAGAESNLIRQGKLRTDSAPDDAPFTAETLVRDFNLVALRDEYGPDGRAQGNDQPASLRRWSDPVSVQVEFGDSTDIASRRRDRMAIGDYAERLQGASGHPVGLSGGSGNFVVMILSEDERRAIGPRLAGLVPGIPARDIAAIRDLSPQNYCTVFAYSRGAQSEYAHAVAVIRAELPPRLRASCIHEELAQGMGLANDDPRVRPSIFNDDEEFALLTRHDELLLKILYDSRLRPGMSAAEATPIVRTIAAELVR